MSKKRKAKPIPERLGTIRLTREEAAQVVADVIGDSMKDTVALRWQALNRRIEERHENPALVKAALTTVLNHVHGSAVHQLPNAVLVTELEKLLEDLEKDLAA